MPRKGNKSHKSQSDRYKAENRWAKNKVKKLTKVLAQRPTDKDAAKALTKVKTELGMK